MLCSLDHDHVVITLSSSSPLQQQHHFILVDWLPVLAPTYHRPTFVHADVPVIVSGTTALLPRLVNPASQGHPHDSPVLLGPTAVLVCPRSVAPPLSALVLRLPPPIRLASLLPNDFPLRLPVTENNNNNPLPELDAWNASKISGDWNIGDVGK
jgi:hypothetical protein